MATEKGSQLGGNDERELRQEKELFEALMVLENAEEIRNFLLDIFTVNEIKNAAKRWCAVRVLLDGDNQVSASERCGVDKNTANRANTNIIKRGTGMSQIVHERVSRNTNNS